jgi:hypothetical protein
MMTRYAVTVLLLAVLNTIITSGCQRASATGEEHLEHHVPPHKPPNLSSAIDQIERRFESLVHGPGIRDAEAATQLQELIDIVRWLPEIAGDSDLPEEQWNAVDEVSQQLWPRLQDQLSNAKGGREVILHPLHDQVDAVVERLGQVAGRLPDATASANSQQRGHHHD